MRSHVEAKLAAALKRQPFFAQSEKDSRNSPRTSPACIWARSPRYRRRPPHYRGPRDPGRRGVDSFAQVGEIRSLVYNLKKLGFLQLACNRFGGKIAVRTRYRTDRNSHFREGRRLSTERLAVLMLKKYAPDIRVEVRSPALQRPAAVGSRTWNYAKDAGHGTSFSAVLSYLWMGRLSAQDEEGHLAILERDGSVVCRIRSESRLDFFRLSRREAISCVELWHELRGCVAGLTIEDTNRCFDPIRESRSRLACVERIEIRAVHPSSPRPLPLIIAKDEESLPLTPEDDVLALSCRVYRKIDGFHRLSRSPR